ncbi:MAG: hypothetical protein A2Y12_20515 [Planctomycetes bacterium GWF2_42_9]|nr:MAG: hypothetical protein A2Y12_20515 [Planctomycetes bacterium GWF2_42_9]
MSKLKAVVIGCGAIGTRAHIPYLSQHSKVNVVAACDIDENACKKAKELNVPKIYQDWEKMLDIEKPDIVSVCTPNYLHKSMVIGAASRGIHVLCEKPMATTLADAKEMAEVVKKNDVKCMVGFTHRFMQENIKLKSIVDSGEIGTPFFSQVRFAHAGPENGWSDKDWWFKKAESGGGSLVDMAVHAIDITHWIMGPTRSVNARVATLIKKIEVDDNSCLILQNDKGMSIVNTSWSSPVGINGILVVGTKGAIERPYGEPMRICKGLTLADGTNKMEWQIVEMENIIDGYKAEFNAWIEYVIDDKKTVPTVTDGIAAQAVIEAAYKSSANAIMI